MKKQIIILGLFILGCLSISEATAQRGRARVSGFERGQAVAPGANQYSRPGTCMNIENLTPEQRDQMRAFQLQRVERSTAHRAQMDELRARKRSLMIQDQPDMSEVNKVIDQMSSLSAQWMKENEAHRQHIRSMLTEEQRILFDSRTSGRPFMQGLYRNSRKGMGRGIGPRF